MGKRTCRESDTREIEQTLQATLREHNTRASSVHVHHWIFDRTNLPAVSRTLV